MTDPICPALRRLLLAGVLTLSVWAVGSGCATSAAGHSAAAASSATGQADAPAATHSGQVTTTDDPLGSALASGALGPIDPMRPGVQIDLDSAAAKADLWVRVRRGFAMPDLDNDLVRDRERWYASRPDYVERMTTRGGRYLFHIVEELESRGMPTELALLPFIESAFNPQAMSSARASGMWQFMPATGRDFALKQNIFRDDRRDVLASTRAALDYLQRLYGIFGDWHLSLAAYNWGEGNVQRAMARNQKAGLPTDYLSLNMPDETRNYVPKLQAVKNMIASPQSFGLTLPLVANHPYFLSVPIQRDIDVDKAVALAGITLDEFKTLNPQMNKPVILAAGTPQILLPYDNASSFVHKLAAHRAPLATWRAWVAPKTMRTADVAHEVGMDERQLREVNRIPPRMRVKAGSTLLVPRSENQHMDVAEGLADNATITLEPDVPPLKRVVLKAGVRDSVPGIARRYGLAAARVAEWNSLRIDGRFKPGAQIVIYRAAGQISKRSTRVAVRSPATKRASSAKAATVVTSAAPARKPLSVASR
ncbi:MAG: lytic transglycosylase [Burkholderiales bacterium 28-67-8]|nr:MAG: lytic transglycosylase [Burkholderiales bacterium 28-67-8]